MSEKVKINEAFEKPQATKSADEIKKENEAFMNSLNAFAEPKEETVENQMDPEVLKRLKNKLEDSASEEEEVPSVVTTRDVSIEMAIIGVGQAGSRIAEVFHQLGYDVGIINTSAQDLKYVEVLPHQKLLLEGTLGGTGKDLDLGREIFAESTDIIHKFINPVLDGNDMVYLTISGGGGTGSSSVDVMVEELFQTGMPVGVIYVLPKATDDAQSKRNSIETLARLARMTSEDMISSLVVVDNARIEQIYGGLGQSQFWSAANKAIVEPIHLFNSLTAQASAYTSLDPSDFGKIISCGDCSINGVVEIEDYMEETALAEAVIESLNSNMLAEGFDLSQTRVGGVIIMGSEKVLDELPAINIDYAFHIISEQTSGASIYRGVYSDETIGDKVKIYSWFAGLGLPQDRITNLQKESQAQEKVEAEKQRARGSNMALELEDNKVNSVTDEIHRKIQKKKGGFNKLQRGSRGGIIDRRRRR